jgi:hypothetical protein
MFIVHDYALAVIFCLSPCFAGVHGRILKKLAEKNLAL